MEGWLVCGCGVWGVGFGVWGFCSRSILRESYMSDGCKGCSKFEMYLQQ